MYGLKRARPLEKRLYRNSTEKKPEWFKGKISYNSFNSNIELIDGFQNFPNKDFEFINQEKYISVKEKLKQNQKLWKNTIKENNTVFIIIQRRRQAVILEIPDTTRFSNSKSAIKYSQFVENSI